jgi:phage terminase large subunit-like protein
VQARYPDAELAGLPAFFGLDLSSTIDLTALSAIIPYGDKLVLRTWAWLPKDGLREREQRDRVPYGMWAEQGLLEFTDGNAIDLAFITERVKQIARGFEVARITYDRWGSTAVSQELTREGLTMVELGQGFASLSQPTKMLQAAVLRGELAHNGNSLLRWQAANCTVASDAAGNIKPVKQDRFRHRKHIDNIVAAVMAMDGVQRGEDPSFDQFIANPLIL